MDRRALLARIAAVTGCAFAGSEARGAAAAAPALSPQASPSLPTAFSGADLALLDEVAETILPRTDTPGAKDAAVGAFIARYATACYSPAELEALRGGIMDIDERMRRMGLFDFVQADGPARAVLLREIDREAGRHARTAGGGDAVPHYFSLMKQLTLLGFFTSEPGETQVLRYRPVPGPYRGCVPYAKGQTFWAS